MGRPSGICRLLPRHLLESRDAGAFALHGSNGGDANMAMKNLELHRSDESIWDRTDDRWNWDVERWLIAAAAGAFLIAGLRRRSLAGLGLIVGGGTLAWWASAEID